MEPQFRNSETELLYGLSISKQLPGVGLRLLQTILVPGQRRALVVNDDTPIFWQHDHEVY